MVDGRQPPPNRPRPAQMLGLSFLTLVGAMGTSRAFVPSPTARMPASSTGLRSSVAENDALEWWEMGDSGVGCDAEATVQVLTGGIG